MRYIKTFEGFGDIVKNSVKDFFKTEPSDEIKKLDQSVNDILPKSFEKHAGDGKEIFSNWSKVIGLYTKMTSDLGLSLNGKDFSRNDEYDRAQCEDLVDKWMRENNQDIYQFYHKND